jgi:hypothetical protein
MKWDAASDKYLMENYETISYQKLADHFGRSVHAIRNRLKILGAKRKRHCADWTIEEDALLKEMYEGGASVDEICEKLSRSTASVRLRASKKLAAYRDDRFLKLGFRSDKNFYYSLKTAINYKTAGAKCCLCGYAKHIDLHHKDGNRKNNHRLNISSLCPNCHREVENGEHKGKSLECIWWRVYSTGRTSEIIRG